MVPDKWFYVAGGLLYDEDGSALYDGAGPMLYDGGVLI